MLEEEPQYSPRRLSEEEIDGLKCSMHNVDPTSAVGRLIYEVLELRRQLATR